MGARTRIVSTLNALVILAGGASTRMGQDKASLLLNNNQTLLNYVIQNLSSLTTNIFVSGNTPANNGEFISIQDLFEDKMGPVGGIISSLIWINHHYPLIESVYFVAVDTPRLNASTLSILPTSSKIGSYFKDNPLPMWMKINDEIIDICHKMQSIVKANGGYSVKALMKDFGGFEITDFPVGNKLQNLNYREDWEKFKHENSI